MDAISLSEALHAPLDTIERLKMTHVTTGRDDDLHRKFEKQYRSHKARMALRNQSPADRQLYEGTMLAVTGQTQAGKTTAITRMFKKYPEFNGYEDIANGSPLISLRAPPACTPIRLAIGLLDVLGLPLQAKWPSINYGPKCTGD